jgi:predicted phage terminase large subunit-like protein
MSERQRQLDAILRRDLGAFVEKSFRTVTPGQIFDPNWHLDAIAWRLNQCLTGEVRRLVIALPPRNLKSISASVAFPAFALGQDPTRRIVCVSYSAELSAKHARDCRAVMESPWYKRVFPGARLSREKNTELDFMSTERGFRLSTSVGGTLTGRGGNLIVLDDPMKPEEAMSEARRRSVIDFYRGTLQSRLDDKRTGVIILIMQRLHIDDLVGHVLEGEDWTVLKLPAIAEIDEAVPIGPNRFYHRCAGEALHPTREPVPILEELRRSLGSFHFAAQYQQSPVPLDGEMIKWKWFLFDESEPVKAAGDLVVQSWDTASKAGELNDHSVCTTWIIKGDDYHLLDVYRARLNYPELKRAIEAQAARWRPDNVLIEDKASGTALLQDFAASPLIAGGRPIAVLPEADKITRAAAQSAVIEAGRVFLPSKAPWLDDFRSELLQFPHGSHDDQVDSLTQFLQWARNRAPLGFVGEGVLEGWY